MKNTVLTYLSVLFLITLTSCQHAEEPKSTFNHPEELILGFKFNKTSVDDIKKRFYTHSDKNESFFIYTNQLKFLDAKQYIISYENKKLAGILITFDLARYEEFMNFFGKYSKTLNLQDIGNSTSMKGFYIRDLKFTVGKTENKTIVSVFPNDDTKPNISVKATQKDVIKFFEQNL